MNVIVVGAGEVGFHTANRLSKEGHNVTVIDKNPDKGHQIQSKLNALVIQGSGASAEVLEKAGIKTSDLFIAVTNLDEVNLVACMLANEYKVPRRIARINALEYTTTDWEQNARKLGIDLLINPQNVVADEVFEIITYTAATEAAEFADGQVVFLGYVIGRDSPLAGITLKELGGIRGLYRMVVTALVRKHETIIPRGEDAIQEGDLIYFVCNRRDLPAINYLFGFEKQPTKRVFILGGGRTGAAVARKLLELRFEVKIIDLDWERCEELAEEFEDAVILNAKGTDLQTLKDEGLEDCDVFVAVTEDEQANILCALLAKNHGAKRGIALVNRHEYLSLAPSLGVDACVSPRLATAAAILKHVRRGVVAGVATLEQSDAEVLEFVLPAGNAHLHQPLRDLDIPRSAIIGAIVRRKAPVNGQGKPTSPGVGGASPSSSLVIIPSGEDKLEPDDHVIVFALPEVIAQVERMFS